MTITLPNDTILEILAEILAVLARLSDDYTGQEVSDFSDVAIGSWYYSYVGYAEKLGVINGYTDGLFYPQKQITRAEFAAIMCRQLNLAPDDKAIFPDVSGHWAAGYISRLCSMEVISGYPDGTFQPERAISRAEAAKIINRIYQRTPQPEAAQQKLSYPDVTPAHWAWAEIVEASTDHRSSDY